MASRKENWAKVKAWTPTVTADFEGPRLACAVALFGTLDAEQRKEALKKMVERDEQVTQRTTK